MKIVICFKLKLKILCQEFFVWNLPPAQRITLAHTILAQKPKSGNNCKLRMAIINKRGNILEKQVLVHFNFVCAKTVPGTSQVNERM